MVDGGEGGTAVSMPLSFHCAAPSMSAGGHQGTGELLVATEESAHAHPCGLLARW